MMVVVRLQPKPCFLLRGDSLLAKTLIPRRWWSCSKQRRKRLTWPTLRVFSLANQTR
uniref:Uncharacterized protein n=1 Tax=Brassica oleracea TaxID=3712 RepID=A0A3P6BLF6_BRAOL|nr:unnamed protein product [Brassica oleracea]